MDIKALKSLLVDYKEDRVSIQDLINKISKLPYEDISLARVDHHRHIRSGIPEVIFGLNKTNEEIIKIANVMYKQSGRFLITKTNEEVFDNLKIKGTRFYKEARAITCNGSTYKKGDILILSAGTSDRAVAQEAEVTASFLGSKVETITDVGVAGIHRLFDCLDRIKKARVLIVIAGMEGALPSVVGGLTDKPVIAVPTSTGNGTSFGGITALFAMLNSCTPGLAVVNIDNGFGAACLAHKINTISSCRK
ncbi:MAG: nickel pincer cofactor biosynthesis protein LarB [Thermodesulfovibrionales bacterium]|nr:nickel pincer cofactor biosynthesis protein LarB [Thermodesulfovibrionales bacterium]